MGKLKDLETNIRELLQERYESFLKIKDGGSFEETQNFIKKAGGTPGKRAGTIEVKGTQGLTSKIKSLQTQIDKLKAELGWSKDQIKLTQVAGYTNPHRIPQFDHL